MTKLELDPRETALLVMDCQEGIVAPLPPAEKARLLKNLAAVIPTARKASIPVIYVVVEFREGYPEVSDRNTMFRAMKEQGTRMAGTQDVRICPEIPPQEGDWTVVKKRRSAFAGSDLELLLRSREIGTLVLTGVSSLGVVESTARYAFDVDFVNVVLGDCCADRDPEAHAAAVKWLLPRVSTVVSAADFIAACPALR